MIKEEGKNEENPQIVDEGSKAETDQEENKPESPESESVKSEIEELQLKYNELNDKYLRLYSEFDNFRKRTSKEKLDLYKTAGEDVIISMLPVMDDFERAMKSITDSQELSSVVDGIKLIHNKFEKSLEQKGLRAMESSVGKEFDVNLQEAITKIPAPEKKLKGKVIDEVERGYMLYDKVIRYAKVVIGE